MHEIAYQFNAAMSAVRIAVGWAFKYVKKYFTYYAFLRKATSANTPVEILYYTATVLWDFRACLYGSQAASFFECSPPFSEEYVFIS